MAPGVIPGTAGSGMSAEETIARQVVHEVLPGLEELLFKLARLQRVWNTPGNNIPGKIVAAAQAGQPLAQFSPADWARWGQGLEKLQGALAETFTVKLPDGGAEDTTLEDLLLTKYVPMEQA